jgi:hypothetical protein
MVWTAPLDQRSQDRVGVHADHTRHGDRLGKYAYRVRPAGSDALGTSGEVIDGRKGSLWHAASMTESGCVRQGLPRNSLGTGDVTANAQNAVPAGHAEVRTFVSIISESLTDRKSQTWTPTSN